MQGFERLGVFYLGKTVDDRTRERTAEYLLYDSKDLTTHAMCVGMTGSGKTGLCIGLLEEAAIDGIPALVIDPKGDMTNLLLSFPELSGADLLPWINTEEAARRGLTPAAFAEAEAQRWRAGLAEWEQSPDRIRMMREHADFDIYTPGSLTGKPLSVLQLLSRPDARTAADQETLFELAGGTVSGLLGLVGIQADPLQSREHILMSNILLQTWYAGRSLDLGGLIEAIQNPPFRQIGVMNLETFYPEKDRFQLALLFNNLLASPQFIPWMQGDALDIDRLLYSPQGKPKVSILSLAHLNDSERMFIVSLVLNQVVAWMRGQTGSSSLKAILYMDEIFGFFPPVAEPPSKAPLLTLLKQARAYGLGVVLTTQNPVDLDYKGLSNIGTWLIGRLQTERDKARLLDGLEGTAGQSFSRSETDALLSGLGNRIFLMKNVHETAPVLFESRWCLSYLAGPLSRLQIQQLVSSATPPAVPEKPVAPVPDPAAAPEAQIPSSAAGTLAPTLEVDVPQYFAEATRTDDAVIYKPTLLGVVQISIDDDRKNVRRSQQVLYNTPIRDGLISVDWQNQTGADLKWENLPDRPTPGIPFDTVNPEVNRRSSYIGWQKGLTDYVYRNSTVEILYNPAFKLYSADGEAERDFLIRLQQVAREYRDELAEDLRKKYGPKIAALQEKVRKADQAVRREEGQAKAAKNQTAISIGSTLLGAFMGRKPSALLPSVGLPARRAVPSAANSKPAMWCVPARPWPPIRPTWRLWKPNSRRKYRGWMPS